MAEVAQITEKEITPLSPTTMQAAIHGVQQMSVRVPAGTTVEELETPRLWAFVLPKLIEGAEIRILPMDMAYRCEAIVTHHDGKNIRVKVFNWVSLLDDEKTKPVAVKNINEELTKAYKLVLRGTNKYCVQRLNDGEWVKEHIPSKQEATVWIEKYILAVGGDVDAIRWLAELDY